MPFIYKLLLFAFVREFVSEHAVEQPGEWQVVSDDMTFIWRYCKYHPQFMPYVNGGFDVGWNNIPHNTLLRVLWAPWYKNINRAISNTLNNV